MRKCGSGCDDDGPVACSGGDDDGPVACSGSGDSEEEEQMCCVKMCPGRARWQGRGFSEYEKLVPCEARACAGTCEARGCALCGAAARRAERLRRSSRGSLRYLLELICIVVAGFADR